MKITSNETLFALLKSNIIEDVDAYEVRYIINFLASRVPYFAGNLCARKLKKAQKKRVNIMSVQYFCGICYLLHRYQQEWCQLFPIINPLFITLTHNIRQLIFLPLPPPSIKCATTNRGRLHHQQNTLPPWFGWKCESICLFRPLLSKLGWYEDGNIPCCCWSLRQPPRLQRRILSPPLRPLLPLLPSPLPKNWYV